MSQSCRGVSLPAALPGQWDHEPLECPGASAPKDRGELVALQSFCLGFGELLLLPPAQSCRRAQHTSGLQTCDTQIGDTLSSLGTRWHKPFIVRLGDFRNLPSQHGDFGGIFSAGCWKSLLRRAPHFPRVLWPLTHSFLLKLPFYCAF